MTRRRAGSRKPAKAQQKMKAKRGTASTPARHRRFSALSKDTEVARLARERDDAVEQLSATSEVLKIISSSPGELEPVFNIMLANARRLCEAKFGDLYIYERGALRLVASHDVPPAYVEARRRRGPFADIPDGYVAETIRTKQPAQAADLAATRPYAERNPIRVEAVELGGIRTAVAVPMVKDNELIGVIGIYRQEVRPFSDKQIDRILRWRHQLHHQRLR